MKPQYPEKPKNNSVRLFVDAHVHIHDCFHIQDFLDAAAENFSHHATMVGGQAKCRFVLCLTESSGTNSFAALLNRHGDSASEKSLWTFRSSGERGCLLASHPDRGEIVMVAGRQIVTAERLEILGLGLMDMVEDGLPISEVVQLVTDYCAIPVLPWGFGKWLGARRQVVKNLLENVGDAPLYLGDNSGRPGMISAPHEFSQAAKLGMRILPGSDPLPFSSEYDRAGSFGFFVDGVEDCDFIWTKLRTLLQEGKGDLRYYGSLESPFRFLCNQIGMQYLTKFSNRRKVS